MGMNETGGLNLLFILWGEDRFSMEEALVKIKNGLGDLSMLSTNTSVLEGAKLTVSELKTVAEAAPFLSLKRLIVINGLLERFEPKDKSSRSKKTEIPNRKPDESGAFAACLKGLPESTVAVLVDYIDMGKKALQNNALFQAVSAGCEVRPFPLLKGIKLSQWIEGRVTVKGGSISRQAINILIENINGDLYTMSNEISKLTAYTAGRMIEEKDVRLVVSASREADIFALVDAVVDHRAGLAEQIMERLLQNGVVPQQILAMLARQIQMLIQVRELKQARRPSAEIQTRLGIFNSFVWDKLSARSEKYTMEKLIIIYRSLLATDLAIKTGKLEGDLAVNILVADLCEKAE
jgi:DNA polymerase III subunit delta